MIKHYSDTMSGYLMRQINKIVENCEDIQRDRYESEYTKECAKLSAYNEIAEVLGFRGMDD